MLAQSYCAATLTPCKGGKAKNSVPHLSVVSSTEPLVHMVCTFGILALWPFALSASAICFLRWPVHGSFHNVATLGTLRCVRSASRGSLRSHDLLQCAMACARSLDECHMNDTAAAKEQVAKEWHAFTLTAGMQSAKRQAAFLTAKVQAKTPFNVMVQQRQCLSLLVQ